jgi:hypothetical protein
MPHSPELVLGLLLLIHHPPANLLDGPAVIEGFRAELMDQALVIIVVLAFWRWLGAPSSSGLLILPFDWRQPRVLAREAYHDITSPGLLLIAGASS